MKVTIVLTPANHDFLRRQEGSLSDTINEIVQSTRVMGSMYERMQASIHTLDDYMVCLGHMEQRTRHTIRQHQKERQS